MARPLAPRRAAVKSLRSGSGTHVRTTPLTVAVWTPLTALSNSLCHFPGPLDTLLPGRRIGPAECRPRRRYRSRAEPPGHLGEVRPSRGHSGPCQLRLAEAGP